MTWSVNAEITPSCFEPFFLELSIATPFGRSKSRTIETNCWAYRLIISLILGNAGEAVNWAPTRVGQSIKVELK